MPRFEVTGLHDPLHDGYVLVAVVNAPSADAARIAVASDLLQCVGSPHAPLVSNPDIASWDAEYTERELPPAHTGGVVWNRYRIEIAA